MKPLQTVDARTLLSTPLQPVRFIVDGLLPQGLHLLGGSPKIGKSWLMLWLCLKVAEGEPLWEYQTSQCGVLYLCLEDTFNRIQSRLFLLTDSAPEGLRFSIAADTINAGLQNQIGNYLQEYPATRLVVIDTLQRIRQISADNNAYANDYRDISALKELADKNNIAVVIVHHLRKQDNSDPFMKVSGTTGITGAVDSTWVLEKDKRSADTAKLYVTGRDIDYQEITLQFKHCIWEFVSCEKSAEITKRETPQFLLRLVDFMFTRLDWQGNATELLESVGESDTPSNIVTKLLNQYHSTFLSEHGIIYEYNRTGKGRIIHLRRGDGCVSNDGSSPTGKEPSQPSPTVM